MLAVVSRWRCNVDELRRLMGNGHVVTRLLTVPPSRRGAIETQVRADHGRRLMMPAQSIGKHVRQALPEDQASPKPRRPLR